MDDNKLTVEDELMLQAYLDGELPSDEQQIFEARLTREPVLTAVLRQWRNLMADLDTLPEPQLTHDLTAAVLARLDPPQVPLTRGWRPLLIAQVTLTLLTALLAWPLFASWPAVRLVLPDWALFLRFVWSDMAQEGMAWWTANVWTPEVWLAQWTAVWQGLDQTISMSLSLLLPLVVLAAMVWLVSLRFIWRSAPLSR
jgi:anti-sigma factor RsiW